MSQSLADSILGTLGITAFFNSRGVGIQNVAVVFSRVKALQGLYILNSNAPAVKESSDVQ